MRNLYVETSVGQMHAREREGGGPAIVLLHQTASSAASFAPLMAALDLPNRLVAVDTPGFGRSDDPAGWPSLADYAGWTIELLDALGIADFHACGHHTGANIALELAARHPARVRSVMLMAPPFMTTEERRDFAASGYDRPIQPVADGSHLLVNWDYAARHNPDCPPEIMHEQVVDMLRAWRGRPQAYAAVANHDPAPLAQALACPVLLLTTPDDFFRSHIARAEALMPHAETVSTGGGNFPATVAPREVAAAITAFLARQA